MEFDKKYIISDFFNHDLVDIKDSSKYPWPELILKVSNTFEFEVTENGTKYFYSNDHSYF